MVRTLVSNSRTAISKSRGSGGDVRSTSLLTCFYLVLTPLHVQGLLAMNNSPDSDRSLVLLELLMSIEELNESSVSTAAAVALSVSTGVIVANLEGVPVRSINIFLNIFYLVLTYPPPPPQTTPYMQKGLLHMIAYSWASVPES